MKSLWHPGYFTPECRFPFSEKRRYSMVGLLDYDVCTNSKLHRIQRELVVTLACLRTKRSEGYDGFCQSKSMCRTAVKKKHPFVNILSLEF